MNLSRYFLVLKVVVILVLFSLLTFKYVFAAPPNTITVTPSLENLDLQTDKPTYSLTYQNTTSNTIELSLSARDFSAFDEGWKLNFLSQSNANNYHYSLSSWIHIGTDHIILEPGEKQSVQVYIDNNRISPGSHYAAILATLANTNKSQAVSINGVLTTLLFVRTNTGHEIEDGKITALLPIRNLFEIPQKYIFRFQNNGNVEAIPYGLLTVYDPLGNLISKTAINQDSLITLPESLRRYDVLVNTNSQFLLPGIYSVTLNIHYGKTSKVSTFKTKLFSEGSFSLIIDSVILLILISGLYYIKKTKLLRKKTN